MERILYTILTTIEWFAFGYLGFSAFYIFAYAVFGKFYREKKFPTNKKLNRTAVLIPGYKEDSVIISAAQHAVQQNYPKTHFDVVVIADSFKEETLEQLRKLPINLIEVKFDKSTKAKSINKALEQIVGNDYDIAVVLDSDNLMQKDFLNKINNAYNGGFRAIQCHRAAKNKNTSFAFLDAANEEINNHIFRKGHRAAGISSALIGSGMAFDFRLFMEKMATINDVAGEDKELELKLLKEGVKILYLDTAVVLDEKVQNAHVFANQRRRWIATQVYYFKSYFFSGIWALITKGNIDYFNKTTQTLVSPRILLLGSLTLINTITLFWPFAVPGLYWNIIFLMTILALWIALPISFYSKGLLKALLNLPKSFFYMIVALFKIKGADKKFIHTPHSITDNFDVK